MKIRPRLSLVQPVDAMHRVYPINHVIFKGDGPSLRHGEEE
jgi:hypothetical protein